MVLYALCLYCANKDIIIKCSYFFYHDKMNEAEDNHTAIKAGHCISKTSAKLLQNTCLRSDRPR